MNITSGKYKSRKLLTLKCSNVRPTLSKTRAAIFDILQQYVDFEASTFLDLFAGSGIMGLEALSRNFKNVVAVEHDKKTYSFIKKNYELLGENPNVFCSDSIKYLNSCCEKFDVIFVDPPYEAGLYDSVLQIICEKKLLSDGGVIILEAPKSLNIEFSSFEILKQKIYGDKLITFLR